MGTDILKLGIEDDYPDYVFGFLMWLRHGCAKDVPLVESKGLPTAIRP